MRIAIGGLALGVVLSASGCWNPCDGHWKYDPPLPQCMKARPASEQRPAPASVGPSSQPTAPAESGPASQPTQR